MGCINLENLKTNFDMDNALTALSLDNIGLESVPEDLFSDFVHLRYLSINKNEITTLPKNIFKNNKELLKLYIAYNKITNLPDGIFKPLVKLCNLDMNDNNYQSLPKDLLLEDNHLPKLESLSLINRSLYSWIERYPSDDEEKKYALKSLKAHKQKIRQLIGDLKSSIPWWKIYKEYPRRG